jgi:DNA-binding IclR family transcriptional regulator
MGTTDRSLAVLKLFTLAQPVWTAEQVAHALQVSMSTAYRYVLALEEAGLVAGAGKGKYVLGPALIKLDRQIQFTDPLLHAARPVMDRIAVFAPDGAVVVLCRSFGDSVLCVHQVRTRGPQPPISYERGRAMPLLHGATSRIILAHQPLRLLRQLYLRHQEEIRSSGFGAGWEEFRTSMARLRKAGHAVSRGEIDRGRIGIAAALLDEDRRPVGSLSYVVPEAMDKSRIPLLASIVQSSAREIESRLTGNEGQASSWPGNFTRPALLVKYSR